MSSPRVSLLAEAFTGELLGAALTAYLLRANPSALFGHVSIAASCAATQTSDPETRKHLMGFAHRCLELERAELRLEDDAFNETEKR